MALSEENLWKKSATEVVSLLKRKEISPDEALDANLKRIKETANPESPIITTFFLPIESLNEPQNGLNNIQKNAEVAKIDPI